jgi:hypothetical protein
VHHRSGSGAHNVRVLQPKLGGPAIADNNLDVPWFGVTPEGRKFGRPAPRKSLFEPVRRRILRNCSGLKFSCFDEQIANNVT